MTVANTAAEDVDADNRNKQLYLKIVHNWKVVYLKWIIHK